MEYRETITWPGWKTVGVIGCGSFGTVYEIQRDMVGDIERAALKHISIPASQDEVENLMSEGMDAVSITKTFRDQLNDIVEEYKLMRKLNDCPYVVRCDDVHYAQKGNGFGWDILIRMELLTPITKILSAQDKIPEEKVIRLGKDISRALIRCEQLHILHRDIKIQNIFMTDDGKYKLGDFGIARSKERTSTGTARIGTYDYMAPEVYWGRHYDHTADIYSLGIVLYWLLNNRRMPFLPQTNDAPRVQERETSRMRRLNGEKLPPPANGSKELKQIVRKCCAYMPQERYTDAGALLEDLLELQRKKKQKPGLSEDTKSIASTKNSRKSRRLLPAFGVLMLFAVLLYGAWKFFGGDALRPDNAASSVRTAETVAQAAAVPAGFQVQAAAPEAEQTKDPQALFEKGRDCYEAGDYGKALEYFIEAAEGGNARAMTAAGLMYRTGRGTAQDNAQALAWFERGANAGDADAMAQIGFLFCDNQFTAQDYQMALRYFLAAGRAGNTEVLYPLGEIFEYGLGVQSDLAAAAQWYLLSAEAGVKEAQDKLKNDPLCSLAAASEAQKQAAYLHGTTGELEPVFTIAYPLYLDNPVEDLKTITMVLTLKQWKSGWPYGNWFLCVRDPKGDWHPAVMFRLDQSLEPGQTEVYNLAFDKPESFTALALCPADNGVDFSVQFDMYFLALKDHIGEYSGSLQKPPFTPSASANPIFSIHTQQDAYTGFGFTSGSADTGSSGTGSSGTEESGESGKGEGNG